MIIVLNALLQQMISYLLFFNATCTLISLMYCMYEYPNALRPEMETSHCQRDELTKNPGVLLHNM